MYRVADALVKKEEIDEMLQRVSDEINWDYAGKEIVMVGVLRGALVFLADIMRRIKVPVIMDFMVVSSYGVDTESSGVVLLAKDVDTNIEGKHVILVEDLIDTGITLNYLKSLFKNRNPASFKICAAFDKPARRKVDIMADYTGIELPDVFAVGYGLDFAGSYRNLPEVHLLEEV